MSGEQGPMVVVAGSHVIEIRVDRSDAPRSMVVSVELDYGRSWLFDEPGWQDLTVGVTNGAAYWWSARHLVVLPTGERQGDPVVITADEDIRLALAVIGGSTRTITDPAGNSWTDVSDLLGRQITATAPDTGTTTSTYNDLGQLTSATDARGKTISYAYDADGRCQDSSGDGNGHNDRSPTSNQPDPAMTPCTVSNCSKEISSPWPVNYTSPCHCCSRCRPGRA